MHVLLIKDDSVASQNIEQILSAEGFTIDTSDLGAEGEALNHSSDCDIIVLDVDLSQLSSSNVLHSLLFSELQIPLLILTGLVAFNHRLYGSGIDDDNYLTKPFHKDELIARIHALVQRASANSQPVVQVGDLQVDLYAETVEVKGRPIHVTRKEYQILELLLQRRGTTLTKTMLLDYLYGGINEPEHRIIDVFICKLRKKLSAATGGEYFIETIWGRGYAIAGHDEEAIKVA